MSNPHVLACVDEIIAALQANDTPTKNFDLSDDPDNRVVLVDDYATPHTYPCVLIAIDKAVPTYDAGASLGQYDNLYLLSIWCVAPADNDTADARIRACVRLAHDVIETIEEAHADIARPNLHGCTLVLPVMESPHGGGQQAPAGAGVAYITVNIRVERNKGI
jgi:hypothetical protein